MEEEGGGVPHTMPFNQHRTTACSIVLFSPFTFLFSFYLFYFIYLFYFFWGGWGGVEKGLMKHAHRHTAMVFWFAVPQFL